MRNNRRIISVLLLICLLVVLVPANWVKAEEKEEDKNAKHKITISVNGIIYENVKGGTECIIGDTDINDIEVKIISVDGHELENVGTKSGVLDALGRTVLLWVKKQRNKKSRYISN